MIKKLLAGASIALMSSTVLAIAATTNFTEGKRDQVVGGDINTVLAPTDSSNTLLGYDLGTIGGGDAFGIYGRIVGASDYYSFSTTSDYNQIHFDFDGFDAIDSRGNDNNTGNDAINGNGEAYTETVSGFIGDPPGNANESWFAILIDASLPGCGAGGTLNLPESPGTCSFALFDSFATPVTSGPSQIFNSFGAGEWIFAVVNEGDTASSRPALYDITISAVPLPAAAWLLLAGVGGLAAVKRRKKS